VIQTTASSTRQEVRQVQLREYLRSTEHGIALIKGADHSYE